MRPKKYILVIPFMILLGSIVFVRIFRIYFVSGDSMAPSLTDGQVVLLMRDVGYEDIDVGDVIVFNSAENGFCIKRVAAKAGDSITQKHGELHINNACKYRYSTSVVVEYVVKDNEFYVLGDNSYNSTDSRSKGTVPYCNVVGKVVLS